MKATHYSRSSLFCLLIRLATGLVHTVLHHAAEVGLQLRFILVVNHCEMVQDLREMSTFKQQQCPFYDILSSSHRDQMLFSLTLGPFNLHNVCSRVFRVLMGNSLLHCFSFSLGKTFMKMWMSRRILSRLMLLMVSGNSRTILQRHY